MIEDPESAASQAAARDRESTRETSTPGRGEGYPVVRRVVIGIGIVLVALCALIIIAACLPSSVWRRLIVYEVSQSTGREATIKGDVRVRLLRWNPDLSLDQFSLSNADWARPKPMLAIRHFEVSLSLMSVFRGHLILPRLTIDGPAIDFERDSKGRDNWDFSKPGAAKPKPADASPLHIPVIQQLRVSDGTLTASDRIRKLKFDGRISVHELGAGSAKLESGEKRDDGARENGADTSRDSAETSALSLLGKGTLNDKPFELRLNGGSLIDVDPDKPYDFDAAVTASDIKLNANAVIAHPFDLGSVRVKFGLSGGDLADMFYLTGLALPNTPPYDISGTLRRDNLKFSIDDLRGKLGSSDIAGKLSIDTAQERPKLTAQLDSKVLNFADLAAPLGSQATPKRKPNSIGQPTPATNKRAATASAAPPDTANDTGKPPAPEFLLPDADLQINRVRGMDADVAFDAASVVTPKLPMKKVHFHLILDNGKLTLDPLTFALPEGQFSGTVAINARTATPQTDLDMKLVNVDMSQFKSASSTTSPFQGQLLGRIRLHGNGSSVHKAAANADGDITLVIPSGQMREVFAELTGINVSKGIRLLLAQNDKMTDVHCGVVNFHANDGNMEAKTFVIDTTHVMMMGRGHIDLKTEDLDLSLRGQPKELRLLRLRSPVKVHGTLSDPHIGLQTGNLVGQAGGAIALGALLTPVAALLAFVDKGLAKDANCTALTAQAEQDNNLPTGGK